MGRNLVDEDLKAVNINVSIPKYLRDEGKELKVNFSEVLKKGLIEEIELIKSKKK